MLYGAGEIAHSKNCLTCKAKAVNLILGNWIKQASMVEHSCNSTAMETNMRSLGLVGQKE